VPKVTPLRRLDLTKLSSIAAEALKLTKAGYTVTPVGNDKRPLRTAWQRERLPVAQIEAAFASPDVHVGLVLNLSGLVDIEYDDPDGEAGVLELFGGSIPRTPTWSSQRGLHRLYQRPDGLPDKAKIEFGAVEVRGCARKKGAQSVLPPSGGRTWLPRLSIHEVTPALLPAHVVQRLREPPKAKAAVVVAGNGSIPEGVRNDTCFRKACELRDRGLSEDETTDLLLGMNGRLCTPALDEKEIRRLVESAFSGITSIKWISSGGIEITPPILGEAAYHGLVGDFLKMVSDYSEATDAGVLAHLLPAAGAIIGPRPHVYVGTKHCARINTVVVGPTSTGRKGTACSVVDYAMEMTFAKADFWRKQRVGGLSSGEGLINRVADYLERDKDGNKKVVAVEKRLYAVEVEFSRVLANMRREGNVLSQVIREAFDSGNLATLTVNPRQAHGAHIAIVGHITPEELLMRLPEIDCLNGFANRIAWFLVKSDKIKPLTEPIPDQLLNRFTQRFWEINGLQRDLVEFDASAKKRWTAIYPGLREDKPGVVGAITGRGTAMVPRLALIYALIEKRKDISVDHLQAALAVWQYCCESVHQLFGTKAANGLGEKVLRLLRANGPMTRGQFNPHFHDSERRRLDETLAALQSAGLVRQEKVARKGAGRPATRWRLTPPQQN
jgi:hypothetical protein